MPIRYPRRLNPVSPLGRAVGTTPLDAEQLLDLRRRVWRESGIAVMRPEDVTDEDARRVLVESANQLFGVRHIRIVGTGEDR